jgi:ribosomal protein S18 acetylase RimI-like enzyme
MAIVIRDFRPADCNALVEILQTNLQYGDPASDGPDAMLRVHACKAAEFLVAEQDGQPVGMIRGVYDGSKALIHVVSVHPTFQHQGLGTALVREMAKRFKKRGATSLAVTVPGNRLEFWKRLSFKLATRIMLAHPIDRVVVVD